jgi:predicted enzyme related to lactoylglutathione lyase
MEGKVVHIELPADDTERARAFWGRLAGWQFASWEGPVEYHMFEGDPGGAIYRRQQGEKGLVVYFGTDDIDRTLQQIRELRGEADAKQPIPGVGWFARCKDSEGNAFSIFESDESVAAQPA